MATLPESSDNGASAEHKRMQQFDFTSSDFATIAKTTAFIDRTLMIRDVYNVSSKILITAPRKFGKSTNMDMVKRFFEITVDNVSGKPKDVNTTENYRLFKDNNLQICKDTNFFNDHFGKHPVLHIDFEPLGGVTGFAEMIDAFKCIVTASFGEHRYLLKNPLVKILCADVWGFSEDYFKILFQERLIKDVDAVDLKTSFKYLSASLYKHFGTKVFVLIDNYDAYFGSLLFRSNDDDEKIISFLRSSIRTVLDDKCVERVLISGVLPVIDGVFPPYFIEWYQFLDRHPFTKYYGLTCDDLDNVIDKLTTGDKERSDVKNTIDDYYGAYNLRTQPVKVYNTWSVLQYLFKRTVQSHWCRRTCFDKFETCLKIGRLRTYLEELLINYRDLDVLQPLSVDDVFKLNKIIRGVIVENLTDGEINVFFRLLYQLGYLSVVDFVEPYGDFLSIASEEFKRELAKVMFNVNGESYKHGSYGLPDAYATYSAVNAIHADGTEASKNIETFVKKINWGHFIDDESGFCSSLFMNFVTCVYGKGIQMVCRQYTGRKCVVIVLKNKHQVAVYITYSATNSHDAFKLLTNMKFDVFDNVRGTIIIGIDKQDFTYSYCFGQGDSLRESKTIKWKNEANAQGVNSNISTGYKSQRPCERCGRYTLSCSIICLNDVSDASVTE